MTFTLPSHGVPSSIRFTRAYSRENRGLRRRDGTMRAETKCNRRVGSSPRETILQNHHEALNTQASSILVPNTREKKMSKGAVRLVQTRASKQRVWVAQRFHDYTAFHWRREEVQPLQAKAQRHLSSAGALKHQLPAAKSARVLDSLSPRPVLVFEWARKTDATAARR